MLAVSEMFYSIQGEGVSVGQPSLFCRLKGCNLMCGGPGTQVTKQLSNGATWRCDTIEVWMKGEKLTNKQICDNWIDNGWLEKLKNGAHLVITGGEPLLQQKGIESLLNYLKKTYNVDPYVEIETNGTISLLSTVDQRVNQYNVSLKLPNSGMKKEDFFNKQSIDDFEQNSKSVFKFVVSTKQDIEICLSLYIKPFNIDPKRVVLMPAAHTKDSLNIIEKKVIEWCKLYNFRYSPRLHISIWNQKTGV